jgi:hypothetical protein
MNGSPIDDYLRMVDRHLRWRRFLERRALREVRDHLSDVSKSLQQQGCDPDEAQRLAIGRFGPPDGTAQSVIESNRGLAMRDWLSKRALWVAGVLVLPAIALLGLSFLTFNFPCRESVQPGFQVCGLSFLQGLRPILVGPESNLLLLTLKFSLTILAPLLATVIVVGTSARFDLHRGEEGSVATVAIQLKRTHVVVAVASLIVFAVVLVYQLAS